MNAVDRSRRGSSMKGLIVCAGKGTRMQPFTFTSPKTLLPVANEAILDHCLRNLAQAGINEIAVVINRQQTSVAEHLSNNHPNSSIHLLYQSKPLGIAHAVAEAKAFIEDEPFVLLLGDILIDEPLTSLVQASHGKNGAVMLSKVDHPQDYGVAVVKHSRIVHLEEKPHLPKSDLAVAGAYVFDRNIFTAIENTEPSSKGEYEITSAMRWMITNDYSIGYTLTQNRFFDVGTTERWLEANRFILKQRLGKENEISPGTVMENCTVIAPVKIGSGCILKNAVIGPYVSVQSGCSLIDCSIQDSICMEGTIIRSPGIPIMGSLFGRSSRLEGSPNLERISCVLGDKSWVGWS